MKLSDFVVESLIAHGITDVFMITGGGAMHLNDSVGKSQLRYFCNHHEQASAMAAEGYARVSGKPGVVFVTTGPGGINAINGVFGAWTDSIPMLVISGQVKRETFKLCHPGLDLRQLGDQETDIVGMVKGITKYSAVVSVPESISYHVEKALHLATSGRPGPCWLDIPVDVQSANVEPEKLRPYDPSEETMAENSQDLTSVCADVLSKLQAAKRPVVMPGSGVRLARATDVFERVIKKLGIPVTPSWTAIDILPNDSPLYAGRPGTVGDRAGNFSVQNSDMLLVLGSRLNIRQIGYSGSSFAPNAFKMQVDIDASELAKPNVKPDWALNYDLKSFLETLEGELDKRPPVAETHREWLSWCQERVRRYPVVLKEHREWQEKINPYFFMEQLFSLLENDDIVVCGNGSACVITFQAANVKVGQRIFTNSGCASMGYDLPAAIGAAIAAGRTRQVVCIAGDGSIQMNIQELQTVVHHRLPLKIFVLDNAGYSSIRQTQQAFFQRFVGESPVSGVSFPDMVKLAGAYGIQSRDIAGENFLEDIRAVLNAPCAQLAVVKLDPKQGFQPKTSSLRMPDGKIVSRPLEDMYPFLDRDEFAGNMIPTLGK